MGFIQTNIEGVTIEVVAPGAYRIMWPGAGLILDFVASGPPALAVLLVIADRLDETGEAAAAAAVRTAIKAFDAP